MWTLNIPPVLATVSGPANTPLKVTTDGPTNLGAKDPKMQPLRSLQPTMMEKWTLTAIWLPILISVNTAEAAGQTLALQIVTNLRYGGDIVWSQGKEIPGIPKGNYRVRPITVGESFNSPIEIRRGRVLTVEAVIIAPEEATLEAILSAVSAPGGPPLEPLITPGTISYDSAKLTGHREL